MDPTSVNPNVANPDGIVVVLSVIVMAFTILTYMLYERITWLTGSMESHSTLMLRLEALRTSNEGTPIKVIWWDPKIEDWPHEGEHGDEAELKTIYLGIPLDRRKNKS